MVLHNTQVTDQLRDHILLSIRHLHLYLPLRLELQYRQDVLVLLVQQLQQLQVSMVEQETLHSLTQMISQFRISVLVLQHLIPYQLVEQFQLVVH